MPREPELPVNDATPDLAERAERYAITAHRRVDHRRKYSGQPYDSHLRAVAGLVGTVSRDPEVLAAAVRPRSDAFHRRYRLHPGLSSART